MEYFISDLHFGHKNIIKLCNRPFSSVEEMNNTMIEKWNNKVSNNDTVYILGDFSWYKNEKTIEILNKLNGNKVLIKGNHDSNIKGYSFTTNYYEKEIDGKYIIMFHYPILEWNGYFRNSIHLYGHTHIKIYDIKNAYSVCCEVLDYEPCTLEEVIERNKKYKEGVM